MLHKLLATRIESLFLEAVLNLMRMSLPHPFTRILFAVLLSLCLWGGAEAMAGDISYVVRRGETLSGIARKHGVSVAALAERNRISKNHYVKAGQRLMIPKASSAGSSAPSVSAASASGSASSSGLTSSVSSAISNASVAPGRRWGPGDMQWRNTGVT